MNTQFQACRLVANKGDNCCSLSIWLTTTPQLNGKVQLSSPEVVVILPPYHKHRQNPYSQTDQVIFYNNPHGLRHLHTFSQQLEVALYHTNSPSQALALPYGTSSK